jgi:hypothetical protein
MGRSCEALLGEVGIPSRVPEKEGMTEALAWADGELERTKCPVAIFVKRGIFGA